MRKLILIALLAVIGCQSAPDPVVEPAPDPAPVVQPDVPPYKRTYTGDIVVIDREVYYRDANGNIVQRLD